MKRRTKKELKDAQPKYRLIMLDTKAGKEIFGIMKDMTNKHHEELRNATIAPAWMIRNKTDRDGILVLGKMKKATELERLAHGNDAFLLLNQEAWERFDDRQKRALIDHELEHLTVSLDEGTGEPKLDGHGKVRYRIRRHDVEEFQAIISRHGCHKLHLRRFAEEAALTPLGTTQHGPAALSMKSKLRMALKPRNLQFRNASSIRRLCNLPSVAVCVRDRHPCQHQDSHH